MFDKANGQVKQQSRNQSYSLSEIKVKNANYGTGVILDTNFFDNVKPRNWGKKVNEFVYNNLAGKTIDVYNQNNELEQISFAKTNERVKKDGANNSHKVINKLARSNNNIKNLSIVQIEEVLQSSKNDNSNKENSHQWLDSNGWDFKKVYLQTKNGKIYEALLNIAKTKDGRNILYDINKIKKVDDANVSSLKGLSRTSTFMPDNISQNDKFFYFLCEIIHHLVIVISSSNSNMQQNSNNTQFAISDFARNQPQVRLKDTPIADAFAGAPVYQQANGVNTFYTDDIQISDADIDNTFNRSNTQNNTQNSVQNTEIAYLDSNITNKFQQAGLSTNAESITIDDSTSSRLLKTDITANDIQNIDQIVEDGTITKTSSNEALVRSIIDNNEYTLKATVNENNIEVQDLSKRVLSQQELENNLENNVENSNKIEYNRQGI